MNEESSTNSLRRNVNIQSAIDKSSFQIPVFVAISVDGGDSQVAKTFASAREVFDKVFSILLDRLRQRQAVEAVERLVPQSAHLSTSRETEYVLLVRGKAIFWFSGAAARRAAGRKLLLEHARDLAKAERAPFYVLNSRPKKLRAAFIATGLAIVIPAGLLLRPFVVNWTGELTRHRTPHQVDHGKKWPDQKKSATASDIHADHAIAGGSVDLSANAPIASRHGQPASAADPKPVPSEDRTAASSYDKQMTRLARPWPDQFRDRLLFAYSYFDDQMRAPATVLDRTGVPLVPRYPTVPERQAKVSNLSLDDQAPTSAKPTI